ncbi:sugar ABC transporter substrate-binding protein [Paenibacillus beijingensis]|uniref:Ribose ABC transporter substrate-binding protein n=1 Tax=Paenibacillus beijingensis TaxID=1126833 RepID=A0A0D5NFL9_9BACL|nr:substrate-binding domain-containing protein [Paenibacillus beijingensis]AJY74159.1 ribose ABC transporter substrate-binding protein [Paenibacillus beijingensis]
MKKWLSGFIAAFIILSLAACGGKSGDSQKTVAILSPYLSSVTTNQMIEVLKKQSADQGWKTNVVDTKGDVGQLASRMEDVISTNVDAIIIVSTDPNQLKSQIQQASEKNIPVFGCDSGYIEGMAMNATSDNEAMSKMITEYLLKTTNNKANMVVLTYRPHPGVLKRSVQLDKMLEQTPDVKKVTEQEVQVPGPIENSRKQMESLLLANKDAGAITAVWAGWDEPAIGAAQAIEASGRKDIVVTGIDGNSQAIDMIKKGSPLIATVQQNFDGMAELVVKQIGLVFEGKQAEDTQMYAPATLITKENAK